MADFWIKIEKGTPDKPEILELASALGIPDPDTVTGKMIRVWAWFDSNSANGHAPSVTNVLLDRLTGVTGFTDALVTVGWLDKTDDGFLIPNFDRHLGKNAKKRALDTERKRKSRNLSQECPAPNVTKKGLDKSRVDKSRVENKKQHKLNTCSTQDEQNPTNQEPITKNQEPRTNNKTLSSKPSASTCPHLKIIELYHEILPELPRVIPDMWKGARAKALAARWKESDKHQRLEFWKWYFNLVRKSQWHLGVNERGWQANLEWLVKQRNFVNMIEKNRG